MVVFLGENAIFVMVLYSKLGDEMVLAPGSQPAMGSEDQNTADAIAALEALGSKPKDALEAIRAAIVMLGPDKPVDELVRAALQKGK